MAVSNIVKRIQDIMREDSGINGDAQRIEQMTWIFFLKVYDTQEEDWELDDDNYKSIIPEHLRWRNWAHSKDSEGKSIKDAPTGDDLLNLINNELFPVLKGQKILHKKKEGETETTTEFLIAKNALMQKRQSIVLDVFKDLNQYMKNGVKLRQVIDVVDEMDMSDSDDRHQFGFIYETMLKSLQSAGNAGEFYTPRALTDFIVEMLNPTLDEKFADFTSGTGGFLVSAINHLQKSNKDGDSYKKLQTAVKGQEWKPLPYLLSITNLLLHDIEAPDIKQCDSLEGDFKEDADDKDLVDVIGMNPPYGGSSDKSVQNNFPAAVRTSETADLFMYVIMKRLREGGRAGVIIPDGFLFGTDGAKKEIKTQLLTDYNVHTIIRLPGSIFSPYTSIATNIIFFDKPSVAKTENELYTTKETWFYRLDMPEGYKNFSKTKPMQLEHCEPIRKWWTNRQEIINSDSDIKAKKFTVDELIALNCNFDQCKFPKEEKVIKTPSELLADYWAERKQLDATIDSTLQEIEKLLEK